MPTCRDPWVLYEIDIQELLLTFSNGTSLDVTSTLTNGRASYVLFQRLVAHFTGLVENSEGGASDLVDEHLRGYEVKSYRDPELYPMRRYDEFQTSASSTFGANNHGPLIKRMLAEGDYPAALALCKGSGFDKNDFYVYTNTGGFRPDVPFRYLIVPTSDVLELLSPVDPRKISRSDLQRRVRSVERLG